MKCPIDNTTLLISDRNGIEIDYCPNCRGVWLDRGELDKIIERSSMASPRADGEETRSGASAQNDPRRKPKKKSSLLGDLFDF